MQPVTSGDRASLYVVVVRSDIYLGLLYEYTTQPSKHMSSIEPGYLYVYLIIPGN